MNTQKILVVDDDSMTRKMLCDLLRMQHYEVADAEGGTAALELVASLHPDVVLLDLVMPDMDGYEVAHHLRSHGELGRTAIVMITGRDISQEKTKALEAGADDLLSKPICVPELLARVRTAISAKAYRDQLENQRSVLEAEVSRQTAALQIALQEASAAAEEIVHRLARAAELRDDTTGAHVERVGRFSEVVARDMGLDEETCRLIRLAATMHDVGKIGVPDNVLRKPEVLTPEERKIMEQHTYIGEQILHGSSLKVVNLAALIALNHHEWWNGKGYPRGVSGNGIPVEARIVSVVDALDALTSLRPYRTALTMDKALSEIGALSGVQYDPQVVASAGRRRAELDAIRRNHLLHG